MRPSRAYQWLIHNRNRTRILCTLTQPLTATQLATRLSINDSTCMSVIGDLTGVGLCTCLNPRATKSRLFFPTEAGSRLQTRVRRLFRLPTEKPSIPAEVDWDRYGFTCFSHRAAIVQTLSQPLAAAEIKRRIRKRDPSVRISANNIRDALKLLESRQIVMRVQVGKRRHPSFALTPVGHPFPDLLHAARWMHEEPLDWRLIAECASESA